MPTAAAAPDFLLASDSGKSVSLRDFRSKYLVLYFYPKNDTPGCTREAVAFTEALAAFREAGAEVVGVSKDSVASHGKFRGKHNLEISLLSDPDLTVHRAYGAFGEKVMYGKRVQGVIRSTFLIGPGGDIVRAWKGVKVDGHAAQVLAAVTGGGEVTPAPTRKTATPKAESKPAATKRAAVAAKPAVTKKSAKP
jgi:peroxiredoxin Q/BCP